MGPIKFKTWITAAVVLFVLGVLADYYFLHILFKEKQQILNGSVPAASVVNPADPSANTGIPEKSDEDKMKENPPINADGITGEASEKNDNFLTTLKTCAPEIAAQAIATPEALIEYLRKSIGVKNEDVSIENFHMTWKDGSKRRIHVVSSDNTNAKNKKEIRLFTVDAEGYPDPVPLKGTETLESLLAMGQVQSHEIKSQLVLKDGGSVSLEKHDNEVFEFQYTHQGKIMSCRLKDCQCP